jgi:glucan endo-1,3-alpha-glucosidase
MLFFSFDFTAMSCTLSNFVDIINQYADHPNQFKINGKPMISSFEGGCLGNSGWASLKSQTNGYTMPFISSLEGTFPQWPALDSWYWLVIFDVNIFYESDRVC